MACVQHDVLVDGLTLPLVEAPTGELSKAWGPNGTFRDPWV